MPRIFHRPAERGLGAERAAKILGGARREGNGWKCLCPAHDDHTPSLHLSDRPDGGLLAHCFHPGCTQERVIEAMRSRGVDVAPPTEFPGRPSGSGSKRGEDGWTLVTPLPDDAPPPPLEGASATYCYRDAAGKPLFYVARYEARAPEERKRFCPWTFWRAADGRTEWRPKSVPGPRPLYGLELLAARADAPVLVTEGEKPADAARQFFPDFVVVTSPNGAKAAAQADWTPLVGRRVTIWPDADEQGRGFGQEVTSLAFAAGAAAVAVVPVPETWPEGWDLADDPPGLTVRDLQQMVLDAELLETTAAKVEEPVPLVRPIPPPEPYPTDALGPSLAPVAKAIQAIVQSPAALCANSVLAAATLAAQGHVDVELPTGARRPVSNYFVTVGGSGERKSATDEQIMASIKVREKELRLTHKKKLAAYHDELDVWNDARKIIRRNQDEEQKRLQLAALGPKPKKPLEPIILMEEPTIEGLAILLRDGQPSVGVFSPEGGEFIGGHAMKDDAKIRSAAGLSKLWDGETWKRIRAGDGFHTIAHKRVSMHLMVQPGIAETLMSDLLLRDQGLLSRVLITYPDSTMGTRFHREPGPGARRVLAEFNGVMAERISRPYPLIEKTANDLAPGLLRLSAEASKAWFAFSDQVEKRLARGGPLEPISGFAGKMAEHAARLAAVIQWWTNPDAEEIAADTLAGAITLVEHYAGEALRLQQAALPSDIADAKRLLEWLHEAWKETHVSIPDVTQYGPNHLRVAKDARKAVAVLEQHHWLVGKGPGTTRGNRHHEVWRIVRPAEPGPRFRPQK